MHHCGNDCNYEPDRYVSLGKEFKCTDHKCCDKCEEDRCDNPIKVLSNNVIWNGCDLRHLNLKPGDNLEKALIEADAKMDRMEKILVKIMDEYTQLNKKISQWAKD